MFAQTFYHGTIKKYIILFGTLFNEIYIRRGADPDCGDAVSIIRVPITYGPKEKVLQRPELDPNFTVPFAAILPRMSFELSTLFYDSERKLKTIDRVVGPDTNKNYAQYMYQPVPYNLLFTLHIMVKNAEDGTKILEQILPYFTPEWTTTIQIIEDPEVIRDIPVVLNSISSEDTWEGSFEQRRYLVWTINFTLKGYLFGPAKRDKIIKVSKTDLKFDAFDANGPIANTINDFGTYAEVKVTPGLDANGEPTSDASKTVSYSEIDWNDDYGFVTEETIYPNGIKS